jgi:hypothetical protein
MATTVRERIYACGEVSFAKFLFLPSWFAKLLEANFSCFCQNYVDVKLVCQNVGVALSHYNFLELEKRHYYSSILKFATTSTRFLPFSTSSNRRVSMSERICTHMFRIVPSLTR